MNAPKPAKSHVMRRGFAFNRRSTVHLPWEVCQRCGLVALRNEATKQALRAACRGLE